MRKLWLGAVIAFVLLAPSHDSLAAPSNLPAPVQESDGTNRETIFPGGFGRTTDEPHALFYDPFDSALDTTNRWNSPTSSGGGVAASITTGTLTLGTGTTGSGYSYLRTQNSFVPTAPGWLGNSHAISLTDGAAPIANTYRAWGTFTPAATPTTALPITDGYAFELRTNGKMYAVVYAGGTVTTVQDLSSSGNNTQPLDANQHRYIIYARTDKTFFYIDGLAVTNLVATASFTAPQVQTLPLTYLAVAASSAPLSSGVITVNGVAVWDTAKNNNTLSDGTYPWRKLTVSSTGTAQTATPDVSASGTLSAVCLDANIQSCGANSTVSVALAGAQGCGFSLPTASTLVTTSLEVDYMGDDNTTWFNSKLLDVSGNATSTLTTVSGTAYKYGIALLAGARQCRVRVGAAPTGSATATVTATVTPAIGNGIQGTGTAGTPAAGVVTVQGTTSMTPVQVSQATAANLLMTDAATSATGSAVPAKAGFIGGGAAGGAGNLTGITVKAASTGAVATDTALVVQQNIGNAAMVTAAAGVQKVGIVGNAGANFDGILGTTAPANVIWTSHAPSTAAGAAASTAFSTSTGSTAIKASAGNVYGVMCQNTNASVCWLNFYNVTPTCGTTAPVWSIPLAASGVVVIPPGTMALAQHGTQINTCQTISGAAAGAVCGSAMNCVIFYK